MLNPKIAVGISICLLALVSGVAPAAALTQKQCSEKFQAAKKAGTLADKTWNDFRKTECAANAPAATTEPATKPAATTAPAKKTTPAKPATTAAPSNAVFPTAVSSKYSSEKAGRARMHTCRDQYYANKATNANSGLKWSVKGGGYYSECNKRLKG